MSRQLRIEYPGAIYQGLNRGARRVPIFRDETEMAVTLQWIAVELPLGSWTSVANRLQNAKAKTK